MDRIRILCFCVSHVRRFDRDRQITAMHFQHRPVVLDQLQTKGVIFTERMGAAPRSHSDLQRKFLQKD
jgi:hypothetical protein